jgi:simple sugar transport system permease protein
MGILFILFGVAIWFLFIRNVEAGVVTKFGMTPGGMGTTIPVMSLPTLGTLYFLAAMCVVLGAAQLIRRGGFKKSTNLILGLVAGMFIFGFLTYGAAGKSLSLAGLLNVSLSKAVPLTLGALSGILSERAGVVNIAIEGMMLSSAMTSCMVASITDSLWLGVLMGVTTGAFYGVVHGVLSIKYKVNQIISGTAINIFSTGITSYISVKFLQPYPQLNESVTFPNYQLPLLSKIPFIGPILFNNNMYVYAMYIFLIILTVALFHTKWGLRLRSVGEHPKAADTLGINVFKTRYMAVILGAMMAGFAGSYFTLGSVGRFDEVMTAGRGFIALAAMIFGNWMPVGAFGAGLLFGFTDALASKLAILKLQIPSQFLLMAPYVVTMIVLAGVVGRSQMPAADGVPYEKEGD